MAQMISCTQTSLPGFRVITTLIFWEHSKRAGDAANFNFSKCWEINWRTSPIILSTATAGKEAEVSASMLPPSLCKGALAK